MKPLAFPALRSRGIFRVLGFAGGVVLFQACAQPEFSHLEVEQRSSSPLPVDVSNRRVTIPVGVAVRLKVKPVSKGERRYSSTDDLEFATDNSSVMDAFQVEETSQVVVTGGRAGTTCLRVIVNDQQVECLRVEVIEQEDAN